MPSSSSSSNVPVASSSPDPVHQDLVVDVSVLSLKFLGIPFKLILSDPIPVANSEQQEFRTALWLTNPVTQSTLNLSLPITFSPMKPYVPKLKWTKKDSEYWNRVAWKCLWTFAFLTIATIPTIAFIVFSGQFTGIQYSDVYFNNMRESIPISGIWYKEVSLYDSRNGPTSVVAFFDSEPSTIDSPFNYSTKLQRDQYTYRTEFSIHPTSDVTFNFNVTPSLGYSLMLYFSRAPNQSPLPPLNVTDYIASNKITTYTSVMDTIGSNMIYSFVVHSHSKKRASFDWTITASGNHSIIDLSTADTVCERYRTCLHPLHLFTPTRLVSVRLNENENVPWRSSYRLQYVPRVTPLVLLAFLVLMFLVVGLVGIVRVWGGHKMLKIRFSGGSLEETRGLLANAEEESVDV